MLFLYVAYILNNNNKTIKEICADHNVLALWSNQRFFPRTAYLNKFDLARLCVCETCPR